VVDFFSRRAKAARAAAREHGLRAVVRDDNTVKVQIRGDEHIATKAATPAKFDGRFVTFVPRSVAEEITDDVAIVSIRSRHDSWPEFKSKGPVLRLTFDTSNEYGGKVFDKNDFALLDTFINQNPTKSIVIHCTEARMRSPALARAISHCYEDIRLFTGYPGCPGSTAMACRATSSAFIDAFFAAEGESA
jgi:hypothetical protein